MAGTQIADVETRFAISPPWAVGSPFEVLKQLADALGQLHLHRRGPAIRSQGGAGRGGGPGHQHLPSFDESLGSEVSWP